MGKQISDPSRPTATEIQNGDYFVLDRGENGVTHRVPAGLVARPHKKLRGLISQTGTRAPMIEILENTIGDTPTLSYIDYGVFGITLTGVFLEDKTWYNIRPNTNNSSGDSAYMLRASDDTIRVYANDDTLNKVPFEIAIYP